MDSLSTVCTLRNEQAVHESRSHHHSGSKDPACLSLRSPPSTAGGPLAGGCEGVVSTSGVVTGGTWEPALATSSCVQRWGDDEGGEEGGED